MPASLGHAPHGDFDETSFGDLPFPMRLPIRRVTGQPLNQGSKKALNSEGRTGKSPECLQSRSTRDQDLDYEENRGRKRMTCMDRPIIPSRRSRYVNGNDIHSPESSFSRAFDEAGVRPPRRNIFLERSKLEQLLHDELASDPSSNLDLYSRPERSRTSEIPEGKMPAPYPRGKSGNQAEISSSRTSVDEKRATSLPPRLLSSSFSALDMMPNKRRNRSDLQYERELIPPPTSEEEESDSDYWDFASTIAQHGSPPRKAKKRKVERQEDLLASVREMRIDGLHVGKWKPGKAKEMGDMESFDLWDTAPSMVAEHVSSSRKRKRNSPASVKETRTVELAIWKRNWEKEMVDME